MREHVGGIHGFGTKMVDSVADFLKDDAERAVLQKLLAREVGRPSHASRWRPRGRCSENRCA